LVPFEVQAVNAHISEKSEVHFRLLHETDHEPIKEAVAAKKKGEEIAIPEEEEAPEVINLMDALKQSVASAGRAARTNSQVPRQATPSRITCSPAAEANGTPS
jgi:non-homologous end joining protein Ku